MDDGYDESEDLYSRLNKLIGPYNGMYMSDVMSFLCKKYRFTYEDIAEEIEMLGKEKDKLRKEEIKKCEHHRAHNVAGDTIICLYCPLIWRCGDCAYRARADIDNRSSFWWERNTTITTCKTCGNKLEWIE